MDVVAVIREVPLPEIVDRGLCLSDIVGADVFRARGVFVGDCHSARKNVFQTPLCSS